MPATSEPDASPVPTDLPIPTQTPLPGPTQEPSPTAFDPLAVPLAVVLVPAGDVLNVRREPGPSSPLLAQFPPNESGFFRTGDEKLVGDQRWVQLRLLSGQRGWVNGMYLTEYTPRERFCADPQVITLLDRFAEAVRSADGSRLSALVSPSHGLSVNYFREGQRINYSPDELLFVFESDFETAWGIQPASGEPIKGSFRDVVLPNLDQVLGGEYQTACNEIVMGGSNYNYEWPSEYSSINYYSVFKPGTPGVDLDWRTWLVGVEYSRGRPYLFSLEHLFWEP